MRQLNSRLKVVDYEWKQDVLYMNLQSLLRCSIFFINNAFCMIAINTERPFHTVFQDCINITLEGFRQSIIVFSLWHSTVWYTLSWVVNCDHRSQDGCVTRILYVKVLHGIYGNSMLKLWNPSSDMTLWKLYLDSRFCDFTSPKR